MALEADLTQRLKISNRDARRLWLQTQGLGDPPTGKVTDARLMSVINQIGFVQLDTIRVVARAHDHILWSRLQAYREGMLDALVKQRLAFEHFTHDASVLPMEIYPYWRRQFSRMHENITKRGWVDAMPPKKDCDAILKRIDKEGPLCSKDFEAQKGTSRKEGWARPPHKFALDHFWYKGTLATCHRKNFFKYYDLREKVIPADVLAKKVGDKQQLNWLCENALSRLGFGTEGDIQRFWDAADLGEVKTWVKNQRRNLVDVEIESSDKLAINALASADIEERLAAVTAPTSRLRLLNPFDPVVRDRNRLQRLFGFDYRIEIFVPAKKRQYGYYVYPILEGDRFVGRAEVRADRKKSVLAVENIWWEKGVQESPARKKKLDAELERMARFVGCGEVEWK